MTCGCSQAGLGHVGRDNRAVMVSPPDRILPLLSRVTTYFSGMGIIKNYLKKKGTGFITDLVTEEDIFFLVSRVTNLPPSRKIKVRALVKYKRAKQPSQRFASKVTFIQ